MASRFGRAGRALLGTQIRGYCQNAESTSEAEFRRTCKWFLAGAFTACNILYCTVHTQLIRIREE
uniref:Uncharacterized protein n=1 Tax=Solanum lycopersicum TaxID=4081 RepID=A0A3Q7H3J7_SOLLC